MPGDVYQYSLNVPAIEYFNNSNITCHIFEEVTVLVGSETAILYIQGTLTSVNLY